MRINKKQVNKRVKKLCEVLEIDHIGLITEGTRRLMNRFNELNGFKNRTIKCDECPFGDNECGWARCPNRDEWEYIKAKFRNDLDTILNKKTFRFSTVGCDHKYKISYPSEELIKEIRKKYEPRH